MAERHLGLTHSLFDCASNSCQGYRQIIVLSYSTLSSMSARACWRWFRQLHCQTFNRSDLAQWIFDILPTAPLARKLIPLTVMWLLFMGIFSNLFVLCGWKKEYIIYFSIEFSNWKRKRCLEKYLSSVDFAQFKLHILFKLIFKYHTKNN